MKSSNFNFLICSERSGSNFITKLMNAHSKICGPSVKHIINPVTRNLFRYGNLNTPSNWKSLLSDINILMSVDFSVWKSQFTVDILEGLAQPGDVPKLISEIFLREARANDKQNVFIKENHLYEFLPYLMINFPESKFIYLYRDPRDMSLSWKKNPNHPAGIIKAARQWKLDQQQSLKSHFLLNQKGKSISCSYENLTSNTENTLKQILKFLGFEYEDKILDFYKDKLTQNNAAKVGAWNNLARPIIKNNSNKFLSELTKVEISYIEKICYFEMKHLGYEPIHSKDELDSVKEEDICKFASNEESTIPYKPTEGVRLNMAAKANFYQR